LSYLKPFPSQAPCGQYGFGTGPRTELTPGPLTVMWEESISHRGSPFRFAISSADDSNYDQHILLNHVPHNDQSGPFNERGNKFYALTLEIPDIDCPNCALQLFNPMTDKIANGDTCTFPGTCTTKTNSYFSCADISIKVKHFFSNQILNSFKGENPN
jgi:hypothetical protein